MKKEASILTKLELKKLIRDIIQKEIRSIMEKEIKNNITGRMLNMEEPIRFDDYDEG